MNPPSRVLQRWSNKRRSVHKGFYAMEGDSDATESNSKAMDAVDLESAGPAGNSNFSSDSVVSSMEDSITQLDLRGNMNTPTQGVARWSRKKKRSMHSAYSPESSAIDAKKTASDFVNSNPIKIALLQESITGLQESEEKEFTEQEKEAMLKTFDSDYFSSYEKVEIHLRMIRDKIRTDAYKDALEMHNSYLQNKSVIDVGCGTGILSLFAARYGAKEVYAIERSSIAQHAQRVVHNSEWYHRIKVLHGSVEEVELPFWRKCVDVIISEWMGYSLLYESMLESVLFARDKWLAPDGLMFPEKCALYLFGSEDLDFYDWKYENYSSKLGDIDLSYLKKVSLGIPVIKKVHESKVVTDTVPLIEYNLYTMKKEDVNFEVNFALTAQKQDYISALSTSFTVMFPSTEGKTCFISTHPYLPITHWKQTCFFLNGSIPVFKGEIITGTFKAMQNAKNKRRIDFIIKIDYEGQGGSFHQINEYSLI